jgi:hypothetical protein
MLRPQSGALSERLVDVLLDRNSFDLVERNLVAGAVIELRRARAGVVGHRLGVFERAAVGEEMGVSQS